MQNQRTSSYIGELMYRNSFDCFKKVIANLCMLQGKGKDHETSAIEIHEVQNMGATLENTILKKSGYKSISSMTYWCDVDKTNAKACQANSCSNVSFVPVWSIISYDSYHGRNQTGG